MNCAYTFLLLNSIFLHFDAERSEDLRRFATLGYSFFSAFVRKQKLSTSSLDYNFLLHHQATSVVGLNSETLKQICLLSPSKWF